MKKKRLYQTGAAVLVALATAFVARSTAVTVNATTGTAASQALVGQPIVFSSGVPDLGTTAATTVTFTSSAASATPAFSIASGGASATGDLTFGSCIFTVKSSTFPAGSKLAVGAKITVSPCAVTLATGGVAATGAAAAVNTTLTLNGVTSAPYPVTVAITPTGTVQVNGTTVTTTLVSTVTGS